MTRRSPTEADASRRAEKIDTARLRAAWAEGIASGDDGPLDRAAIIEEAKREASTEFGA